MVSFVWKFCKCQFLKFENRSKIERVTAKNAKKMHLHLKFRHIKFRYMVSFVWWFCKCQFLKFENRSKIERLTAKNALLIFCICIFCIFAVKRSILLRFSNFKNWHLQNRQTKLTICLNLMCLNFECKCIFLHFFFAFFAVKRSILLRFSNFKN